MAFTILRFDMRAPGFSPARPEELYATALDMATWADEKGFNSLTLSEHHATDDGFLSSPLTLAGCMVGRTRRINIGVVALLVPLYDPVKLAEDLALLDLASGGRVGITAGMGYRREEYSMFGKDWEGRGKLMDECLEVMIRAWTGEPFDYNGRRVHLSPRPLTQPHPPVMVGGIGRNGARRAVRFKLPYQPSVNDETVFEFYRAECAKHGVDPVLVPPGGGESVWVSEDPDRTWAEIGPYLMHDVTTYASWQPPNQRSTNHSDATNVDELRAEGKYLVLTPEQCIERARTQGALAGFVLYPLCGGTPPDLAWQSLELYADKVLPHL